MTDYEEIGKWIYLQSYKNEQARVVQLAKMYERSAKTIQDKLDIIYSQKLRGEYVQPYDEFRLRRLIEEINSEINKLYTAVEGEIFEGYAENYSKTYYYQSYGIERQLNLGFPKRGYDVVLNTPILPKQAIEAAFSEKIAGLTFKERIGEDREILQWKLREQVSSALSEGASVQNLAKAIAGIDEEMIISAGQAQRIARTEMLRAYSYGQDEARKSAQGAGVHFEYFWSATLDKKTRSDHRQMYRKKAKIQDGQPVFTLPDGSLAAGPRMPAVNSRGTVLGDLSAKEVVNCRCRRVDAPMGIRPTSRVGKLPSGEWKEVNGSMTAEKWYKKHYQ